MTTARFGRLFPVALAMVSTTLVSGCLLGWPARAKVSSMEVATRFGTSTNRLETIEARYTYPRCVFLLTPEGVLQDTYFSVAKDYVLHRADGSEAALPFLHGREWKKILPVPSTNLWVAIAQPERRGKRDDLEVVVFRDNDLVRRRMLRTIALGPDKRYHGFLAFSQARWSIWYPSQEGEAQYDILRDAFISPLQEWEGGEATTLMWMPDDPVPPPPE